MSSQQEVSSEDKKKILSRIKSERVVLLAKDIENKLRSLTQTILVDSSADPLYHVDVAVGIDRREILIEALVSELQRLELESMSNTGEI